MVAQIKLDLHCQLFWSVCAKADKADIAEIASAANFMVRVSDVPIVDGKLSWFTGEIYSVGHGACRSGAYFRR
jgi:hypothetical protein